MAKDIPLTLESLSGKENDEHRITSAKAIASVLNGIAEHRARVALYYDGAQDFILTTLLKADSTGLWLERGQGDEENRSVTDSQKNIFVSSDYQIKVQFSAGPVKELDYQGESAYYLPLPTSIYRLQRRDYFRVAPPHQLVCVIPAGRKLSREVPIMDISGGGMGLACIGEDAELMPGNTYSDCQIRLPDIGTITVSVVVKNLVSLGSQLGHKLKRAGCEFDNIDPGTLILLQRYVTNMQRSRLSL